MIMLIITICLMSRHIIMYQHTSIPIRKMAVGSADLICLHAIETLIFTKPEKLLLKDQDLTCVMTNTRRNMQNTVINQIVDLSVIVVIQNISLIKIIQSITTGKIEIETRKTNTMSSINLQIWQNSNRTIVNYKFLFFKKPWITSLI